MRPNPPNPYRSALAPLAAGFLAMTLWAGAALAQDGLEDYDLNYTAVVTPAELAFEERVTLSRSAGLLLRHANAARSVLADALAVMQDEELYGDLVSDPALLAEAEQAALRQVEQALTVARFLQAVLPKSTVFTTFDIEGNTYEEETVVQNSRVDVYDELLVADVIAPLLRTQVMTGRVPTQATLDVVLAENELERAKLHLSRSNLVAADMALARLQLDVVLEFSDVNRPLQLAHVNLWEASKDLEANNREGAEFHLSRAVDALAEYGSLVGSEQAKRVETLRGQVLSLRALLVEETVDALEEDYGEITVDSEQAAAQVRAWWDQVTGWY